MEKKARERKVEDILTNDTEIEQWDQNRAANDLNDYEYHLASEIRQTFNNKNQRLPQTQKDILGNQIVQSINAYKRRRLIIGISSAAVFLLLIGISAVFTSGRKSEIKTFAENSNPGLPSGNTRLILSREEIEINSSESKIKYEEKGNQIHIDSSDSIKQEVSGDEIVYNTVIVPYGKRTQITLADNSSIWLNSGSKLIYPARFAANKREVYLEGEAIFEVSHNREQPFHVITRDVEVKVLGTVFDVCAYRDDSITSTVLEKGSVELKYSGNSFISQAKLTIEPGTMAVYSPQEQIMEQSEVNTRLYTSWREGYLVLERQTLGEILKKISRYYNVSIELNDQSLKDETFTGNLDLRNSAVQVLQSIGEIISAKIEKNNDKILITRI